MLQLTLMATVDSNKTKDEVLDIPADSGRGVQMEIERLDWNDFAHLASDLSAKVKKDFSPQAVVGIGRSGLIPAAMVARELEVSEFYSVVMSLYSDDKPPRKLHAKPLVLFTNLGRIDGKRVLVVDDFANTGSTISQVVGVLKAAGASEVRTAVVALRSDAKVRPDYSSKTFDGCIIFPWDLKPR